MRCRSGGDPASNLLRGPPMRRVGMVHACLFSLNLTFTVVATVLISSPASGQAAEPAARARANWLDPLHYCSTLRERVGKLRQPEIVEMVAAIAQGSQMGPGEGWFHGSVSRYDWSWLAQRYDANHDGKITKEEFLGPDDLFERLDRNHDGVLTSADLDWS